MQRAVAHQDKAGVVRHLPPFVEIERDRVRLLDAGKPRRDVGRHDGERADGAVDVEPECLPPRDAGKRRQVIDGAGIDAARRADQQEGGQAGAAVLGDGDVEGIEVDPMAVVCGNDMQRRGAQPGQIHGLRNAAMRGRRRVGNEAFAARRHSLAAHIEAQCARARDQHAEQVRHRRAGDEQPARAVGEFEQLAQPARDLPLDFDRHMVAAAEIGIEAGSQHLRQHAGHVAAAVHPAHEAGMRIAGGEGKNVTHELVMHRRQVARPGRDGFMEAGADAVGNRLPHRAPADVLDVIENVVEHPMPLRAGALPVGRVEPARSGEWFYGHRAGRLSLLY